MDLYKGVKLKVGRNLNETMAILRGIHNNTLKARLRTVEGDNGILGKVVVLLFVPYRKTS